MFLCIEVSLSVPYPKVWSSIVWFICGCLFFAYGTSFSPSLIQALAKEIVRSRKTVNRLHENKAQMNSISMHLGESVGTLFLRLKLVVSLLHVYITTGTDACKISGQSCLISAVACL